MSSKRYTGFRARLLIASALLWWVCGCSTLHTKKLDAVQTEHDLLTGNESLRIDTAEQAKLDEHKIETVAPSEEEGTWYAPDGGVAFVGKKHWGGSTTEAWAALATAGEEHLELDAGFIATADKTAKEHEESKDTMTPAMSCVSLGWLWGLAVIAALVFAWRLLRKVP